MYFKLAILSLLNLFSVYGFEFFCFNDGYRRLIEEIKSIAVRPDSPIVTRWIEQKLDHFDSNETRTWRMRYYERLDYWRSHGPVYLYIGGEGPATPGFLTTGVMYELAQETRGAMFMSEHRYYGKSQPVKRNNIEDMKFLTTPQALADIANLLRTIVKKAIFRHSKIVVVGGSYAGNLAAWMRLVYPDLVNAAIASSAPVLAKRDFYEYLEVVSKDYEQYGTSGCLENIRNQFQRYELLFQTEEGVKQLKQENNICDRSDITKPENKHLFFLTKASNFSYTVQYATPAKIQNHCSSINGTKDTLGLPNDDQNYQSKKQNCEYYNFNNTVQAYHKEENDQAYCWTYQSCTEFGYYQTATSDNQLFTNNIPAEFYDKLCMSLFGEGFNKDKVNNGVNTINSMYGGKSPNVTQVVFVNGELDPWSALSVLEDISNDAPAVYIPRSSHCRDLFSNKDGDPDELKQARARIKNLIKKWIRAGDIISHIINKVTST
ncbi:putative serine protease K12H4.7 [Epargyreus clarus]|uniref:putative serine protease K12H4.7 n=1 Tax=Epargyreus clarus TaxID=520877 RepID=UPI003C2B59FB